MELLRKRKKKVKDWLIHKLGGKTQEEVFPPIQYTVYRSKVETIRTRFIDNGLNVPKEYVEEMLIRSLASEIKPYVKIEKIANCFGFGECLYEAKINVVEVKE